jgi:hypothetical protein
VRLCVGVRRASTFVGWRCRCHLVWSLPAVGSLQRGSALSRYRAQLADPGLLRHPARLVRVAGCQGPPEAVAERRFCVGLGVPAQVRPWQPDDRIRSYAVAKLVEPDLCGSWASSTSRESRLGLVTAFDDHS